MKKRVWISLAIFATLVVTYLIGPVPPNPVYAETWPRLPTTLTALDEHV